MALGRSRSSEVRKFLVVLPCVFGLALGTPLLGLGGRGGHSLLGGHNLLGSHNLLGGHNLLNHHSGNSSGILGFLEPLLGHDNLLMSHHKERRSTTHEPHKPTVEFSEGQPLLNAVDATQLLRLAATVPVETLNMVRHIAVPIVNTTLALPGNVIQQLLLNNGSEPSLVAMAGLSPDTTAMWFNTTHIHETLERALRFNVSSMNDTHFNLHAFPRNLAYRIGNSSFYNSTSEAAHSAAHMGERLFLNPMAALLAMAMPPMANADEAKHAQYPPSLNADHLQRHLENLRRFFGAAHHSDSVAEAAEPVKDSKPQEKPSGPSTEAKPESSGQPSSEKPQGAGQPSDKPTEEAHSGQ